MLLFFSAFSEGVRVEGVHTLVTPFWRAIRQIQKKVQKKLKTAGKLQIISKLFFLPNNLFYFISFCSTTTVDLDNFISQYLKVYMKDECSR